MTPTIHLTNWSSRKLHSGRVFSIMARPRAWEHGVGTARALVPPVSAQSLLPRLLDSRHSGENPGLLLDVYRTLCENHFEARVSQMFHGLLGDIDADGFRNLVADGDTLCCACARGAECHRRWAAPFLVRAGWRVVLDGEEVRP
jgi:hypothetical protein